MARVRKTVTIRDVAEDAGVSLQTVSRVVNGGPNVRPQLRDKVRAAIERLGYVPSLAAQRMSGSRSYIILAINDRERTLADWRERRGTDWVDQMLLGGILTCSKHGYRMMVELIDTHSDHVERELGAALSALQPDGVILTPPHSENRLITELLAARAIPFARIGSDAIGPGIPMTMGDEGAAHLATTHLAEIGHRRIAMIAGPSQYSLSRWRIEGWKRALAEAGLPHDGLLEVGDFGYESGTRAARDKLLDRARNGFGDRLVDGATRRVREAHDRGVVEGDQRQVVRHRQPAVPGDLERGERHLVRRGDDRGQIRIAVEQRARGAGAGFVAEVAHFQQALVGQAGLGQRALPAFDPPAR